MPPATSVNCKLVVDALAARSGGTAYAAVQVARALAQHHPCEVLAVTRRGSLVAVGLTPRGRLRLHTLRRGRRLELLRRVLWEALALPGMTRDATALVSWSGMLPRRIQAPLVCYLANPVMFEQHRLEHRIRRWAVRRTAHEAAHVLVPTAAMAATVEPVVARTPHVVPLGVDHERFSPAAAPGSELLCVADQYAHKRHDVVLAAWRELPAPRPTLRLVGAAVVDRAANRRIVETVGSLRTYGTIVVESDLSLGELVDAYRRARVFVLASEHESFSMPLLEAQACGVPCVVRDLPALRETGGDGTAYVQGDDPRTWATAIESLLQDEPRHGRARETAVAHAAQYSWERTAAAIAELAASHLQAPPQVPQRCG